MFKLLAKQATLVECGVLEDQADAERWIRTASPPAGAAIDPAAARLLAERGGTDVKRLRNDVDRLLLYALGQKTITVEDVREIAGPAALQDDWAMTNAIEAGDASGRAAAARADARRRCAAGEDPRSARLAGADEVSVLAPGALRGADRRAVPDGPRPQALGRRAAQSCSSGWSSSCVRETETPARRTARERGGPSRRSTGRSLTPPATSREPRRQPRLVAAGGVAVDDALARHLVDQRDRVLQRLLRGREVLAVDGRANALERAAQPRAELAVVLAVLETLSVRLQRGCMRSHVTSSLQNHSSYHGSGRRPQRADPVPDGREPYGNQAGLTQALPKGRLLVGELHDFAAVDDLGDLVDLRARFLRRWRRRSC